MAKWIGIAIVVVLVIMIATGNMGGARDAAQNGTNVQRGLN